MFLLIFEFLGTTELVAILVVALILFGPRKLPQISRSIGKSLNEFKRASEDFKQTWEREVALESTEKEARIERAMLPEDDSKIRSMVEPRPNAIQTTADGEGEAANSIAVANDTSSPTVEPAPVTADASPASEPTRKRDWL